MEIPKPLPRDRKQVLCVLVLQVPTCPVWMINPPGAIVSGGKIPSTGRLGGEQQVEDLGRVPSSSLAAPFPNPLSLPPGAPCSFCIAHSVFCKLSGQGFSDSPCEELVSIFSRQSQKLWEVMERLSLSSVMKGNDQFQAPDSLPPSPWGTLSP